MKKYLFFIYILLFLYPINAISIENKIEFKVNNEIITTVDIIKELNFLAALNPKILKLDKDQIFEISKNSIIKEKIKTLEILKFKSKIVIDDNYLSKLVRESYIKINLNSENEFLDYLSKYNLELKDFKKKITIEALWNQLIFSKFKSKVNIDTKKIKSEIVNNKNNKVTLFNLSEIIFNIDNNQILKKKFDRIKNDITLNGFENAAIIHSISDTGSAGGKLGWINQNSINQKLKEKIKNLNVGEFTKPIVIPGGFLIIKLEDLKEEDKQIDLEEEIKKLISFKTNQQLNQFSNIYYNKIKRDIKIEKL
ncbi:peptidylprolyl isomerase [Candidatus Pelagibacter bacterium nBUS_49]|uniref:peptidylprolyl isomerase n=1 Tax=Candidatus Pelagibacter bacterium nBUS_49 TaxID=3374196 RepID=UPI003EBE8A81